MDRVALAFLSGVSALLLGALLWAGMSFAGAQLTHDWAPSLGWVASYAVVMAVLGFVLLENFVGDWIPSFARWMLNLLRFIAP